MAIKSTSRRYDTLDVHRRIKRESLENDGLDTSRNNCGIRRLFNGGDTLLFLTYTNVQGRLLHPKFIAGLKAPRYVITMGPRQVYNWQGKFGLAFSKYFNESSHLFHRSCILT
jgi:hypothetical protein